MKKPVQKRIENIFQVESRIEKVLKFKTFLKKQFNNSGNRVPVLNALVKMNEVCEVFSIGVNPNPHTKTTNSQNLHLEPI